jgi:hypothetical protein
MMNSDALLTFVLDGVRTRPYASRALPQLSDDEVTAAVEELGELVWRDRELQGLEIADFDALDTFVRERARTRAALALGNEARRVLVVLSELFTVMHERTTTDWRPTDGKPVMIPLGSDRSSWKKTLGEIRSKKHWGRLAEDCMLNAAYKCTDPTVLLAAGRYYLDLVNADVATAIDYFIRACEQDKLNTPICDEIVQAFVLARGHTFLGISLHRYLDVWEKHKSEPGV